VGDILCVSPGYFRTLGVPLLAGREFAEADTPGARPAAVVNETMARAFFPGRDPVGGRIKIGGSDRPQNQYMDVVGVVADVKYRGLAEAAAPALYIPHAQAPFDSMYVVARASGDPAALVGGVRAEVWAMDRDLPLSQVHTMDQLLSETVAQPRFRTLLLALFSGVAALLAAVGIYGVMAYTVSQRTHEIGVRMALGARPRDVVRLVVGKGMALALVGVAIGLPGAFLAGRLLSGLLFGVGPSDPATFAGVTVLLTFVALLACYLPARRAARVDPMTALRYD
jgi:putative ABC transport system permease protein